MGELGLGLPDTEKPRAETSLVSGPPHWGTGPRQRQSSTATQEAINNLFMTFNKTQTSPHWHLIKQSGRPENEGGEKRERLSS